MSALRACGAKRVLDLGCSNGNLLRLLLENRQFEQIVGLDVSHRALEIAGERLHIVDTSVAVARQLERLLDASGLRNADASVLTTPLFYSTADGEPQRPAITVATPRREGDLLYVSSPHHGKCLGFEWPIIRWHCLTTDWYSVGGLMECCRALRSSDGLVDARPGMINTIPADRIATVKSRLSVTCLWMTELRRRLLREVQTFLLPPQTPASATLRVAAHFSGRVVG